MTKFEVGEFVVIKFSNGGTISGIITKILDDGSYIVLMSNGKPMVCTAEMLVSFNGAKFMVID